MNWSGGLIIFFMLKKLLCSLMRPNSPSVLVMMHFSLDTQFSLCRFEVNNHNDTIAVRPCFTLCLGMQHGVR